MISGKGNFLSGTFIKGNVLLMQSRDPFQSKAIHENKSEDGSLEGEEESERERD